MRQVDLFEWHLDRIFEDSYHVTKAKMLDAFHKANPESLSPVKNLDLHFVSNNEVAVCDELYHKHVCFSSMKYRYCPHCGKALSQTDC